MSDSLILDLSKFEKITVRTAKCNICNNKDFVYRCLRCRAGWCSRCRSLNDQHLGDPLAHFNCNNSPVELVGNPQNSPQAWWVRNPPSYRATNLGTAVRPELSSNVHNVANYHTAVPKGNTSTTFTSRIEFTEDIPSKSGPMAAPQFMPPRPQVMNPIHEAIKNKLINNNAGYGRNTSIHRPFLPQVLSDSRKRQRAPSPQPQSSTIDLTDNDSDVIHIEPTIKKSKPQAGNISGHMGAGRITGRFGTPSRKSNCSGKSSSGTTEVNHSIRPNPVTQKPKQ